MQFANCINKKKKVINKFFEIQIQFLLYIPKLSLIFVSLLQLLSSSITTILLLNSSRAKISFILAEESIFLLV